MSTESKRRLTTWNELNKRQQFYLCSVFELDQAQYRRRIMERVK